MKRVIGRSCVIANENKKIKYISLSLYFIRIHTYIKKNIVIIFFVCVQRENEVARQQNFGETLAR